MSEVLFISSRADSRERNLTKYQRQANQHDNLARHFDVYSGTLTRDGVVRVQPNLAQMRMALRSISISDEESARRIIKELESAEYEVVEIKEKEVTRTPPPPFTTSTLQQEAFKKLHFSAKKTMSIAQKLYEGIEIQEERVGLITYMRTDSVNLSSDALKHAKDIITQFFGDKYALKTPRYFKNKAKNVQEAHEAIRPTDLAKKAENIKAFLTSDQWKLYRLIWKRTIACQMAAI